jgi:hypothetical protein
MKLSKSLRTLGNQLLKGAAATSSNIALKDSFAFRILWWLLLVSQNAVHPSRLAA